MIETSCQVEPPHSPSKTIICLLTECVCCQILKNYMIVDVKLACESNFWYLQACFLFSLITIFSIRVSTSPCVEKQGGCVCVCVGGGGVCMRACVCACVCVCVCACVCVCGSGELAVFSLEFTGRRAQILSHDHTPHLQCSDC